MAQETSDMNEPVLHPAPAEGFGAALKRAREAQGISIGDMAARSRLSVQQVRALESERTAELPEPVYVRAFIRGVASVLGLEPDPLVADYTARYGAASVGVLPDHDPAKETVVRASGRRTGLKAAVVAIAAVLVCAAGWYAWSSMSDGAETQPAAETPVVDAPESVEAAPAPEQAAADQTAQEKTAAEQAAAEKAAAEKAAAEKAAAEKAAAEKARAQSQAAATGERRVTLSGADPSAQRPQLLRQGDGRGRQRDPERARRGPSDGRQRLRHDAHGRRQALRTHQVHPQRHLPLRGEVRRFNRAAAFGPLFSHRPPAGAYFPET